jgi:hypothetical protein
MFYTGWVLTILPGLFFLAGAVYGLMHASAMKEQTAPLGWSDAVVLPYLPIIEIVCAVLYLIPQTTVLGVVLLTAYLGGATASHARVNDIHWFAPVIFSIVTWLGVYFRDAKVRSLLPIRWT